MADSDIKIFGRLVSGTSDGVLTVAQGVYDETEKKFQSVINAEQKQKNASLDEKVQTLEGNAHTRILSQSEYDGLEVKDENTVYYIKG